LTVFLSYFPSLSVLPRNICSMIKMQQQPFAPVQKSKPETVVVDEGHPGPQNDVHKAESAITLGGRHLGSKRRIAVHVDHVIRKPSTVVARPCIVCTATPSGVTLCSGSRNTSFRMSATTAPSTSSSASKLKIHSPDALSSAEFFCAAYPFHSSTKTLAPNDRAISTVRSVDPESTTMISPFPSRTKGITLSSVRARFASSLYVMMTTESVTPREYAKPSRFHSFKL